MRFRWLWAVPVVFGAGLCSLFLVRDEFTVPPSFPVLTPEEVRAGSAPADDEPTRATFGAGCFWCVEATFRQLKGVRQVVSGYSGGSVRDPSYEQVCSGTTGHAEVVQVTYDPKVVSYPELLEVFWRCHNPTTRNRQGNDYGPQYRSVVFTHSEHQRRLAELYKARIDAAHVYPRPVVTEIVPFIAFYPAEGYHQGYYAANGRQPYCRAVIRPKLDKLRQVFQDRFRPDSD